MLRAQTHSNLQTENYSEHSSFATSLAEFGTVARALKQKEVKETEALNHLSL